MQTSSTTKGFLSAREDCQTNLIKYDNMKHVSKVKREGMTLLSFVLRGFAMKENKLGEICILKRPVKERK